MDIYIGGIYTCQHLPMSIGLCLWLSDWKNINLHLWGHFSGHKPFFKGAFPTVEEYALFTLEWQHGIDPSVS